MSERALLMQIVEDADGAEADWDDALRRADVAPGRLSVGAARRAHRRTGVSRLTVVVVTLAIAGVVVGTAVAVGRSLFDSPSPIFAPAPDTAIVKRATTEFNGREWSLYTYTGTTGKQCVGLIMGGSREAGCGDGDWLDGRKIGLMGPGSMRGSGDATWSVAWFYGFVTPEIKRLELVTMSCQVVPLTLDDSVFLHVIGQRELESGGWPYMVVGRSQDGRRVARAIVHLQVPDGQVPRPPSACP